VPGASTDTVSEGRVPAAKANGVTPVRNEQGGAVFDIESGEYQFTAPHHR
jgi:hypothetical protein